MFKGRKSSNKEVVLPFPRRAVENISAPSYLAPEEQELYEKMAVDYDIRGYSAAVILEIVMQHHARVRVCREVIKKEGMMIPGLMGRRRIHCWPRKGKRTRKC